jgi:hypothetical protein
MAKFFDKISNLINSQAPEFVVEQHPKFLEFVKTYYTFMESAELIVTSVQTTDGITLETETNQENTILLDGSRIQSDKTQLDSGDKILLESSTFGKFTNGETITGQTSGATATILAEDLNNGRLFISLQNKFKVGETVLGSSSNASAIVNSLKVNPVTNIQELLNFRDPDKVISNFLTKFRNEFLNTLPETLDDGVDKRKLIKNIRSLYRAKGTNRGHELFFRLLFDEQSETIYPREQLLRVSDGKWDSFNILRVIATAGDTDLLIGRTITGQTSKATAIVENVFQFQIGSNTVTEFILNSDTTSGTFSIGEEIRGTSSDESDTFIKANITGIPGEITISNDGALYNENEIVSISGGGTGASIAINAVGRGGITNIFIESGGLGYAIGDDIVFDNTSAGGGSARAKVSVVNGGFTQEESESTVDDHIVLEDATTQGDTYTGNKIVQEAGTPVSLSETPGDVTDVRFISNGFNYTSLPLVSVSNSSGGSGAILYCYGNEIGKVLSLKVNESGAEHELSPSPPSLEFRTKIVVLNVSGTFVAGDTVSALGSDSSTITGTIVSFDTDINVLTLSGVTGTFATDVTITSDGGASATIKAFDQSTASVTISAISTTSGKFLNEDGHASELTMRIQDSLYYQDFSYVIKVGQSINNWRDSFKKTMHAAGYYLAGQVDVVTSVNARIRTAQAINSGIDGTPVVDILNTLFSTIFGRRLGTVDDGTTLRATPELGVDPDFVDSTLTPLSKTTRDVTLKRDYTLQFQSKSIVDIRNNTTKYGYPVAGPTFKSIGNLILLPNFANQIEVQHLNKLRLGGTFNSNIDGQLNNLSDFNYRLKTSFAIPTEIWQLSGDSFDETFTTFDDTTITMDAV